MQAPEFSEKDQLFCVKCRVFLKMEAIFWIRAVWTKTRGSTVVKVLCYESEGRWFDPSCCHWIFR